MGRSSICGRFQRARVAWTGRRLATARLHLGGSTQPPHSLDRHFTLTHSRLRDSGQPVYYITADPGVDLPFRCIAGGMGKLRLGRRHLVCRSAAGARRNRRRLLVYRGLVRPAPPAANQNARRWIRRAFRLRSKRSYLSRSAVPRRAAWAAARRATGTRNGEQDT